MAASDIVGILEGLWPKNKAKGLLAQSIFFDEISLGKFGSDANEKFFSGCWLLSPKEDDFFKYRFSFFIHPKILRTSDISTEPQTLLGSRYRPFHAISEFLNNAGAGVVYAIATTADGTLPLNDIKSGNHNVVQWKFYAFKNGRFESQEPMAFFSKWGGRGGRVGTNMGGWDPHIKEKLLLGNEEVLLTLLLNELFYSGLLKGILKKPLNDPYDVDWFMLSLSQKHILPIEIKEKFPAADGNGRFFGIDVGRILMLLRVCLPNDANAIYLIREMTATGEFVGWKYITLSDILLSSSWNLMAGGPGMGGQTTQTIRLPYSLFKTFDRTTITEDKLKELGNLPKEIKNIAGKYGTELVVKYL